MKYIGAALVMALGYFGMAMEYIVPEMSADDLSAWDFVGTMTFAFGILMAAIFLYLDFIERSK